MPRVPLDPACFETALGLDGGCPTLLDDGRVVPADEALVAGLPSQAMYLRARTLAGHLRAAGAHDVDCVASYGPDERPGGLMLRWGGDPEPHALASAFGPIESWLELRADDHYDARYHASRERAASSPPLSPPGPRIRLSELAERLFA